MPNLKLRKRNCLGFEFTQTVSFEKRNSLRKSFTQAVFHFNSIDPLVSSSRRRFQLPTVLFPQPDSPTSPKVSLSWKEKEIPSTAITQATIYRIPLPCKGKCFTRSCTRSRSFAVLESVLFSVVSVIVCDVDGRMGSLLLGILDGIVEYVQGLIDVCLG